MKKRFLKTAEEVIKELKDGKKIYTNSYTFSTYKMINGIICGQFGKNEPLSINCSIYMDNKFYVEEQEPLKLEVGNFYKTRSGKRAYCYRFESKNEITRALFGFVIDNGSNFWTDINGNYSFDAAKEMDYDIVGYWEAER